MPPSAVLTAPFTSHTRTTRADGGRITVVLDSTVFDWHIDAESGYDSRQMGALLDCILCMGFEALSDDEGEAEILPDGSIRIYFVPVSV